MHTHTHTWRQQKPYTEHDEKLYGVCEDVSHCLQNGNHTWTWTQHTQTHRHIPAQNYATYTYFYLLHAHSFQTIHAVTHFIFDYAENDRNWGGGVNLDFSDSTAVQKWPPNMSNSIWNDENWAVFVPTIATIDSIFISHLIRRRFSALI